MLPFKSPLRRSPEFRRRLTLVLATAEQQLVRAHVEAAVRILGATAGELPPDRALALFGRTMRAPDRLRSAIEVGALDEWSRTVEPPVAEGPEPAHGLLRALARRLRGRQRHALRSRVDRSMAAARDRIRTAYLIGARQAVEAMAGVVPVPEAVQVYLEALEVEPGWAEEIFHMALAAGAGPGSEPEAAA